MANLLWLNVNAIYLLRKNTRTREANVFDRRVLNDWNTLRDAFVLATSTCCLKNDCVNL